MSVSLRLDRAAFRRVVPLRALRVPAARCSEYRKRFESELWLMPRMPNVEKDPEDATRRLILLSTTIERVEDMSAALRDAVTRDAAELIRIERTLDYDYFSTDDVLRELLPRQVQAPSSFETIGHIAHMNLRDEVLPYKHLIGQVILDKNKSIRTVVNKLDRIDHTFRFFEMEVLAGDPDTMVEVHESGCRFRFDFSKVYWNSRLHTEHQRLVATFRPGDYVCDAFAGVGPFAVPAAKGRGCTVYANDLNPESYRALVANARLNKLKPEMLRAYNKDAREFIRVAFAEAWQRRRAQHPVTRAVFEHVVMNLPATAIEFLDALRGVGHELEGAEAETQLRLPRIHCYCFSNAQDREADIVERVRAAMGHRPHEYALRKVRSVAPNKDMYCVSFELAREVAFAQDTDDA